MTLRSVDDLFMVWQILGPEIARLGVRDADPVQRQELIAAFEAVAEVFRSGSTADDRAVRLVKGSKAAFDLLAVAAGNGHLHSAYRRLGNDMSRIWTLIFDAEAHTPSSADATALPQSGLVDLAVRMDWTAVLQRRDGDAAAACVREYLAESHALVSQILSRWPSVVTTEVALLKP